MRENELKHYGVLGMKWGVRKNPSKAFRKASKKARKLDQQFLTRNERADNMSYKAAKKMDRAWTERGYRKGQKLEFKARKERALASKLQRKSANWNRHMARAFYNVSISDIDERDLQIGREYAHLLGEKKLSDAKPEPVKEHYTDRPRTTAKSKAKSKKPATEKPKTTSKPAKSAEELAKEKRKKKA